MQSAWPWSFVSLLSSDGVHIIKMAINNDNVDNLFAKELQTTREDVEENCRSSKWLVVEFAR